jgi:hypothetical protein
MTQNSFWTSRRRRPCGVGSDSFLTEEGSEDGIRLMIRADTPTTRHHTKISSTR